MKRLLVLALLAAALSACGPDLQPQIEALEAKYAELERTSGSEAGSLAGAIDELSAQLDKKSAKLVEAQSELEKAQIRLDDRADDLRELGIKWRELSGKVASLEAQLFCENRPDEIDYRSNSTVSASLKAWLEDTQGSIDKSEWDVIWNNSKATTHKLTGEFLWVYVVWFEGGELGYTNAVLDISYMCYLD